MEIELNEQQAANVEANVEGIDINEILETNKQLLERMQILEAEAKKAFAKRDEVKQKARELEQKLEQKEIPDINEQIKTLAKDKAKLEEDFNNYKYNTALERALNSVDIPAATPKTKDLVLEMLKENATIENGNVVYKDNEVTLYNDKGEPLGIKDKLQNLIDDDNLKPLFNSVKSGGGTKPGGAGRAIPNIRNLNPIEKAKLMKDLGTDKYLELVKKQLKD
jgi:hypothetical protein